MHEYLTIAKIDSSDNYVGSDEVLKLYNDNGIDIAKLAAAQTQDAADYEYDCGLLQGLARGADALAVDSYASMHIEGWIGRFDRNRAQQDTFAQGVTWAAENAKTPGASTALGAVLAALNAIVRDGYGEARYWAKLCQVQEMAYVGIANQIKQIRNAVCQTTSRKY